MIGKVYSDGKQRVATQPAIAAQKKLQFLLHNPAVQWPAQPLSTTTTTLFVYVRKCSECPTKAGPRVSHEFLCTAGRFEKGKRFVARSAET